MDETVVTTKPDWDMMPLHFHPKLDGIHEVIKTFLLIRSRFHMDFQRKNEGGH